MMGLLPTLEVSNPRQVCSASFPSRDILIANARCLFEVEDNVMPCAAVAGGIFVAGSDTTFQNGDLRMDEHSCLLKHKKHQALETSIWHLHQSAVL